MKPSELQREYYAKTAAEYDKAHLENDTDEDGCNRAYILLYIFFPR